ncbi:Na+/H+ antiporter NhaC family protein [Clostridium sp. DJ247]|uniref:Na+/H+ antiporter NhaC family protein n=1 Tax=Clostridium sp. DJ247 TaxID=2726188 RepID=UPI001629DA9C|nr:Na+/H+ antiporter NhaC family protein [Clostridium sp. DJ247]MBC2582293.1 Na+/H+ antiporter NhaC family protein [Clostridium sp. DJ247]
MDIVISMFVTFCALIFSIYKGIFVGYPLLLGFFIFTCISLRRGFTLSDVIKMSFNGGKKAFVVLEIFLLIGVITGIWMASGTVPAIIYYGIKYMNPNFFILYTFILSCVVSFLLGTSLGTVSTVGIALILMAKSGNININIAAGAIIAGAYFGDRCSPMSSSANLVANLTKTNLYTNIQNMFKTSVIPFILSIIIYLIFSLQEPINFIQNKMDTEITTIFKINWIILLPAIIILIFSLFKIDVKLSMLVSIAAASVIAVIFQHYKPMEVLRFIVLGFQLDSPSPLQNILKGGGVISMWKASLVVFISCALSGIFNGTNMLKNIEDILMRAKTRYMLFIYTTIISIVTAAFGCNQSISTVLTHNLMNKSYEDKNIHRFQLAIDLENTGVVLAALIPWNIAAFVPTMTMGVSSTGFIPYACYLYLIPIINILYLKILEIKSSKFSANDYDYKKII